MRLPFIQLSSDFVTTQAPMIAAILRRSTAEAIGWATLLFSNIVTATSTEDKPPDGILLDPDYARIMEGFMGWNGEEGKCVDAFIRVGAIEKLEVGARVRGTDRYAKTWEKAKKARDRKATWVANKKKERAENANGTHTERGKNAPQIERQTQRQTQTQLPSEVVGSARPRGRYQRVHAPIERLSPPTTPRETWLYCQWEQWAQFTKQEAGLVPDPPIPILDGDRIWAAWMAWSGGSVQPICTAFIRYGKDKFWGAKNLPLSRFLTNWGDYVDPAEARRAHG